MYWPASTWAIVQEYEKALDGLEEEYEIDDEEEEEAEELNEEEPERELEDGAEFVEGDIEDLGGYDEDDYDSEDDADLPEEEEVWIGMIDVIRQCIASNACTTFFLSFYRRCRASSSILL